MEFLKDVLLDKYDEVLGIVNDYNQKNPEKAIKLVNISDGGYVGKEAFDAFKAKYASDTEALKKETEKAYFDCALEMAINDAKPKNAKALKALLDTSKISYNEGVLVGLSEQISELKKTDGYLFSENSQPKFTRPVGGDGEMITREEFKKLGYMERLKLKKEAPQIYSKLK